MPRTIMEQYPQRQGQQMPRSAIAMNITYIMTNKADIRTGLIDLLKSHNMTVSLIRLNQNTISHTLAGHSDLVILDMNVHLEENLSICRNIRVQSLVPIIIVSKQYNDLYHIQALSNGADDVVKKPFNSLLLVAKLNAVVWRYRQLTATKTTREPCIKCGELTVNIGKRDVIARGHDALLTSIEFDIFNYLMQNAGQVVSRNDIHKVLYNSDHNGFDRSLDIYISRIRRKIGDDPVKPKYLKTVRGLGYLFVGDVK
jgi:two-component system response regulator RstA